MDKRPHLNHQNGFVKRYKIFNSNITFKEKISFTLDKRPHLDHQNDFVKRYVVFKSNVTFKEKYQNS